MKLLAAPASLKGVLTSHQLDEETGWQFCQCPARTLDFGPRGVVSPHGVESDADHAQASSTSIIFFPR